MKTLQFTARVRENTIEDPGDGGRVIVHCDDNEVRNAGLMQVEVIVNSATDDGIREFPSTRVEKGLRRFLVTVEEIEATAVPPATA